MQSNNDISSLPLSELRDLAKAAGIKYASKYRKSDLIAEILKARESASAQSAQPEELAQAPEASESPETSEMPKAPETPETPGVSKRDAEPWDQEAAQDGKLPSNGNLPEKFDEGMLEILPDGYGFLRVENFMPSSRDIYLSPTQIRRFNLKTGDYLLGKIRPPRPDEKFWAMYFVKTVNGDAPYIASRRPNFEDLTPIFPTERMVLELSRTDISTRIIDLIAPVGLGQRGMIVAPPKAGKTVLIKKIAASITTNYPDIHLIVLLIDERPEEVTDIKQSIAGEKVDIIYSTFDEQPEHHKRVAEMVLERAKRMVEQGKNLVVLLDSITRLSRAYNLTVAPSGRTLSGGLDPAALYMPKKFFGAARNIKGGGSLTILATALVDTGSRLDEVVFEEFKGTGNMELVLDRKLSEKRVFPAIDILKSGTRREEALLPPKYLEATYAIRKLSASMPPNELTELVTDTLLRTATNDDFVEQVLISERHTSARR
ncbi:MAG: transcription termination factor Rho [Defluviitaleaceae bacterium]|nr:transcription termination factor Rho [Defluviitaleaceae bacterium]